jgi:hypothetical protein
MDIFSSLGDMLEVLDPLRLNILHAPELRPVIQVNVYANLLLWGPPRLSSLSPRRIPDSLFVPAILASSWDDDASDSEFTLDSGTGAVADTTQIVRIWHHMGGRVWVSVGAGGRDWV